MVTSSGHLIKEMFLWIELVPICVMASIVMGPIVLSVYQLPSNAQLKLMAMQLPCCLATPGGL